MAVRFFEQEVQARLKARRALGKFIEHLTVNQGVVARKIQLTYIFCTDAHLHGINLQFLQHDDYTDIITFDLSEPVGTRLAAARSDLRGEIYISVERVAENAEKFSTTYDRELHRVIFHGALHLCGLRDKTPAEQKAMRAAEDGALKSWYAVHT